MGNENYALIDQIQQGTFDFNDPKVKSAYALNLCTVSVSQIIDYNDIVILEQEYDAILNNLNLEQMPKDEALLNILKQLLDTITFFRMQEGDKKFIDLEYQNKMKNSIWSAIPNIGFFIGTNPITLAMSLASQVGVGYMNYRKQKAENTLAYEKEQWQLHRAAIEQFNGLRRELFDTAWRLMDAYDIPDSYRLTERQVTQYNEILMDPDNFRRYERLDTIKENFVAYPPFWYFFGNTANALWKETEGELSEYYFQAAKLYFEVFVRSFKACDLLRENQVASSCALEYIDLLRIDVPEEREKISELLQFAIDMSGGANDVLQLCAFSYLKIGDAKSAAKLFRRLVNEDYNQVINAQLLSRYYVSALLEGDPSAAVGYQYISKRIDEMYLYPMPDQKLLAAADGSGPGLSPDVARTNEIKRIESTFLSNQKEILARKARIVLDEFHDKYEILFNKCIPVPNDKEYSDEYFNGSTDAFAARKRDASELKIKRTLSAYRETLQEVDYPYNYLNVLNDMLNAVHLLNCVQGREGELLTCVSDAIIKDHDKLKHLAELVAEEDFVYETYDEILEISFDLYTAGFFRNLLNYAAEYIATKEDIVAMNEAETNLREFCIVQGFETPEVLYDNSDDLVEVVELQKQYLGIELIDDGVTTAEVDTRYEEILQNVLQYSDSLKNEDAGIALLVRTVPLFDRYFINLKNISSAEAHALQRKTVAVLDDQGESDNDLLFTTDGIVQIVKGKMKEAVAYDDIKILPEDRGLMIYYEYENERINMTVLKSLVKSLRTNPMMEVYESKNPLDFVFGWFK